MSVLELIELIQEKGIISVMYAVCIYLIIKGYKRLIPLIEARLTAGIVYMQTCTTEVQGINTKLDEHKEVLQNISSSREAALRMIEAGFDLLSPEQQRSVRAKLDEAREILLTGK